MKDFSAQSKIDSAYVVAPFNKGKKFLFENGYNIISLEENARLRMQEGVESDASLLGNWVREGVLYISGEGCFLTKNSAIMKNSEEATSNHSNWIPFFLNEEQRVLGLENSVKISSKKIPTNRFADDEITIYAFGDSAWNYGSFLKNNNVEYLDIILEDSFDLVRSFEKPIWFEGIKSGSIIFGNNHIPLHYSEAVRGIKAVL